MTRQITSNRPRVVAATTTTPTHGGRGRGGRGGRGGGNRGGGSGRGRGGGRGRHSSSSQVVSTRHLSKKEFAKLTEEEKQAIFKQQQANKARRAAALSTTPTMATPPTAAASTISAVSVVASENSTVTPMATQTLDGVSRTRPSSIFFKNPEVSIAQVLVTSAEAKKPEQTPEEVELRAEIDERFAAHIPSQIDRLKPALSSYIPKEYEDTIDLNHPVAKQARTSYLDAVKMYQAAVSTHAQALVAYYNGDHLWKEMPAQPTAPKTYEEYFKVCKEQYDIVQGSERAYAAAVAAKPSSELPKKPEPVFTPPDETTLIRCSTAEEFELQVPRAKDGLIDDHIETIVHPSLRTVYHMKLHHRLDIWYEFGKPQPRNRYVPRRTPQVYDFSSDSEDEQEPTKMDTSGNTSDETNKRKNDTVETAPDTEPTDVVEPPAKR
jgi:hypothetical protein